VPARPIARLSRTDLVDLNAFMVVARARSFTKAAVELGVTPSAISHAVRNLEERLGVRLLNRTSRTVSTTDAGATLAARLTVGFDEIGGALQELDRHRGRPVGRLRLNVLADGARLLLADVLPGFLDDYPDVTVEVAVDDRIVDIVAAGFDAGIRFGGTVPEDFVAVPIGERLRWVAAAAPAYLKTRPPILFPEDLKAHRCIQIRTGEGVIYRWDFSKQGDHRVVDVPGQLCSNETTMAIDMALAGHGIVYCLEDRITQWLDGGELRAVLPDWAPWEPAFHIYYPMTRQMPPGLRELIDALKARRPRPGCTDHA
jgi:DNA-binding transcriptional LysR family regulator